MLSRTFQTNSLMWMLLLIINVWYCNLSLALQINTITLLPFSNNLHRFPTSTLPDQSYVLKKPGNLYKHPPSTPLLLHQSPFLHLHQSMSRHLALMIGLISQIRHNLIILSLRLEAPLKVFIMAGTWACVEGFGDAVVGADHTLNSSSHHG